MMLCVFLYAVRTVAIAREVCLNMELIYYWLFVGVGILMLVVTLMKVHYLAV